MSKEKVAKEITKVLLKHKLAACVSMIDKVHSIFSWDGEVCEEKLVVDRYIVGMENFNSLFR